MRKPSPKDALAERPNAPFPSDGGEASSRAHHDESWFAAGLRRFSRRLATFGLGEAQEPLLTEEIWSVDSNGNPR